MQARSSKAGAGGPDHGRAGTRKYTGRDRDRGCARTARAENTAEAPIPAAKNSAQTPQAAAVRQSGLLTAEVCMRRQTRSCAAPDASKSNREYVFKKSSCLFIHSSPCAAWRYCGVKGCLHCFHSARFGGQFPGCSCRNKTLRQPNLFLSGLIWTWR